MNFLKLLAFGILVFVISNSYAIVNAASSPNNKLSLIPSDQNDFPNNGMNKINVLFSNGYKELDGSYYITGEFKNVGSSLLENVEVIGHFYNKDNQIIGVTQCCHAQPNDVQPGKSARFNSFAQQNEVTDIPKYYKISFQWKDAGNMQNELVSGDNIKCGDSITFNVKLTSNLNCPSDGLSVLGEKGLTIDLNGHTIVGSGENSGKIGIRITGSENMKIIGNGTIKNFQAGILNEGSYNNSISKATFIGNQMGIFDTGSTNTHIDQNKMISNNVGLGSHSSNELITKNIMQSNQLAGITLASSNINEINSNTISGSNNGMFLDFQSTGNNITSNTVTNNIGVDINNGNGIPITVNNNVFNHNKCDTSVPDGLCRQ